MTDTMTEEEKRKLWEACGFRHYPYGEPPHKEHWRSSDGAYWEILPDFTLDNLFKYVLPVLIKRDFTLMCESYKDEGFEWCILSCILSNEKSGGLWTAFDKNPVLALRDVLWQVFKEA